MSCLELKLSILKEEKELLLKNEEIIADLSKKVSPLTEQLENNNLGSREESIIRDQVKYTWITLTN
ncbi:hypothetical protein [Coxiella-like endosymbiont]|uniref:hypothetical protein n=1 Tax=Coxiella-like endosymbiont TaxID=1592897 RepID=UPI00272C1722|nr:hypothetical protein [Coxiella-like endosymbiont]